MAPDSLLPAPLLPDDAIWVTDPQSAQRINVGPLLRALHDFEPEPGRPLASGAQASVLRVVRFVGSIVHNFQTTDAVELANVNDELWRLWDLFEQTIAHSHQESSAPGSRPEACPGKAPACQ